MTAPERDPFATSESAPAISFNGQEIGTVRSIIADGPASSVHSRDFATKDPLYWVPGQKGKKSTVPSDQPVMSAVVNGVDPNTHEPVSLWAGIPSDLCSKINDAQKAVRPGYRIKAGDRIDVKLTSREPSGKGNPKNVHAVRITPGEPPAPATSDPFGSPAADPWGSAAPSGAGIPDEPPF